MSNYYRNDLTREVSIFRREAPAGYTMIPDMPLGTVANIAEWWRDVDRDAVVETWHPIIQSEEAEMALPPGLAGSGVNIMPRLYSSFDSEAPPSYKANMNYELYPDGYNASQCLLLTATGTDGTYWMSSNDTDWPIKLTANKRWILSAFTKAPTASQPWIAMVSLAGEGVTPTTIEIPAATSATGNQWRRQSTVLDLSQSGATQARFGVKLASAGLTFSMDAIMLEQQVGDGATPSAFVDGPG